MGIIWLQKNINIYKYYHNISLKNHFSHKMKLHILARSKTRRQMVDYDGCSVMVMMNTDVTLFSGACAPVNLLFYYQTLTVNQQDKQNRWLFNMNAEVEMNYVK